MRRTIVVSGKYRSTQRPLQRRQPEAGHHREQLKLDQDRENPFQQVWASGVIVLDRVKKNYWWCLIVLLDENNQDLNHIIMVSGK